MGGAAVRDALAADGAGGRVEPQVAQQWRGAGLCRLQEPLGDRERTQWLLSHAPPGGRE